MTFTSRDLCRYIVGAFGVAVLSLAARASAQAPASVPAPAVAPAEPDYGSATPIPEDMIRRRPRQVIVLPSEPGEYGEDSLQLSGGVLGKIQPDAHRLPEGYVVAGASVSIERQGDWLVCYLPGDRLLTVGARDTSGWTNELNARRVPQSLIQVCQAQGVKVAPEAAVSVEAPGKSWRLVDPQRALMVEMDKQGAVVRSALPLRALPNKSLMVLEAILKSGEKPAGFAVTGRICEFEGHNYILLEHVSEIVEMRSPEPTAAEAAPAIPPAVEKNTAGAAASAPAGREPSPEDIIKHLLDSKPRRAVDMPQSMPAETRTTAEKLAGPVSEGQGAEQLWPEETILVDRPGRVIPGDKWWTFAFEDKGARATRRPVRLLPNRMLETAIAAAGDKSMGVVLIVSGEVTEYRGSNYLLLRKVLVQRDWGNIK